MFHLIIISIVNHNFAFSFYLITNSNVKSRCAQIEVNKCKFNFNWTSFRSLVKSVVIVPFCFRSGS